MCLPLDTYLKPPLLLPLVSIFQANCPEPQHVLEHKVKVPGLKPSEVSKKLKWKLEKYFPQHIPLSKYNCYHSTPFSLSFIAVNLNATQTLNTIPVIIPSAHHTTVSVFIHLVIFRFYFSHWLSGLPFFWLYFFFTFPLPPPAHSSFSSPFCFSLSFCELQHGSSSSPGCTRLSVPLDVWIMS